MRRVGGEPQRAVPAPLAPVDRQVLGVEAHGVGRGGEDHLRRDLAEQLAVRRVEADADRLVQQVEAARLLRPGAQGGVGADDAGRTLRRGAGDTEDRERPSVAKADGSLIGIAPGVSSAERKSLLFLVIESATAMARRAVSGSLGCNAWPRTW